MNGGEMAECCTVATMIIFLYLWGYYSRIQVEHSLQIDKDTPQFKIFTRINK